MTCETQSGIFEESVELVPVPGTLLAIKDFLPAWSQWSFAACQFRQPRNACEVKKAAFEVRRPTASRTEGLQGSECVHEG